MKKIIFNGCSFMAGDELVWEQYHKTYNKEITPWFTKKDSIISDSDTQFRYEYLKYRQDFNLPAIICKMLGGHEKIDLSQDGCSNENIVLETIACLNSFSKEERKNFHVVIGWTSISRIMKYSKQTKLFLDLSAGHYDEHTSDPAKNALREHIKTRILGGDDEDFILDYIKHVMFLENYLIANNISYTFYRALDDVIHGFETIGPFNYSSSYLLTVKNCTRHENWYRFTDTLHTPINSLGWSSEFIHAPSKWITSTNRHPGLETVNDFSTRLTSFIKTQNVL
jgi:hypothetical protein